MPVRLEQLDHRHTDDVVRWRGDKRVSAQLFSDGGPTREQHQRWLASLASRADREEFVIVDETTGQFVGTIGLSHIDSQRGSAQYGVLIDPAAQGRGFARQASELILRHAFDDLALREVVLELFADNKNALRLYESLGFDLAGEGQRIKDGVARNTLVMSLSAERYRALRGAR